MQRKSLEQIIVKQFAGLTLPRGPSGLSGREAELRRFFCSGVVKHASRALYRALYGTPEHRKAAEDYLWNYNEVALGIPLDECNKLIEVMNLERAEPRKPEYHTVVGVSVLSSQAEWLSAQSRGFGERSGTMREAIDLARESGFQFQRKTPERAVNLSFTLTPSQLAWVDSLGPRSEVVRQILDAAMGVKS
jgi:hypothetical protein